MLIEDFVPISRSVRITNALLRAHGPEIARAAARAAVPTESLTLGPPRTRADSLVVPIMWSPQRPSAFEDLQGDLQTSPLDELLTHLALVASCHILADALGRRALYRDAERAAQRFVRAFLTHLATELEHRSPVPVDRGRDGAGNDPGDG